MSESQASDNSAALGEPRRSSGASITRLIKVAAIIGLLLILLLLLAALAAALTAAETWAPFLRIFRDVFLLILLLESVLIVAALAILMLQAAGFLIMLRSEIQPILDNARETTRLSRATAQFINNNAVDPLIQIKSFLSGLLAFLRELLRIRGLVTPEDRPADKSDEPQTS